MKEFSEDELFEFGCEVEEIGFNEPIAIPAGAFTERARRIVIAVVFFERWWPSIHPYCCNGCEVQAGLKDKMDVAGLLVDTLATIKGLPVPAGSLANILAKRGLSRLCAIMIPKPI